MGLSYGSMDLQLVAFENLSDYLVFSLRKQATGLILLLAFFIFLVLKI